MKKDEKFNLPTLDDLFEKTHGSYVGRIEKIETKKLNKFKGHPFKVRDDAEMEQLVESIKENGVLNPVIVRELADGSFEMISGHRRKRAAEIANMEEIPCIVRKLTDEEATILMVDSNLQREEILPSEKAFAYKMKMEAIKRKAGRPSKENYAPVEHNKTSREIIEEENNESREQVRRYIRLTELIPEILNMVDEKKIAFRPAVEISYLKEDEQYTLLDAMQFNDCTPSLAQAISLKKRSLENSLTAEWIGEIMEEEKSNQIPKFKMNMEKIESVLPRNVVSQKDREDFIIMCVKEHNKRQKQKEYDR